MSRIDDVRCFEARIDTVTPKTIQEVFKKDFPMDRYTAVTLVPATPPAEASTRQ